jgi:NADH-quinone oxidoreductase subunit L
MPSTGLATEAEFLWAIIFFPLLGAVMNGLFGRRLGRGNVTFIAIGVMIGSLIVSAAAFFYALYVNRPPLRWDGGTWFEVLSGNGGTPISIGWGLVVDQLSAVMIMVVTGVGTLIHIYSASYMSHEDDAGYARFFTYLNLFVAAMLTLVLGDSLVLTFVGWEGVGLCSYLLIGFWFTDLQKAYAGRKAFVVNRIGDFGFLLGTFSLLALFGTARYGEMQQAASGLATTATIARGVFEGWTFQAALTFALLWLFVGACGKSAQLPLYVWLPDAMAGPTPVSALIHAATMVTAGVYLVARNAYLFSLAPAAMATVMLVGAATALFAALIAFAQNDIKKVLAYSTVSQLGFMFIGVGAGVWWAGLAHLVTHAFFKACLFLGAGSVMHGMGDETDIQKMGGLRKKMPVTYWTFLISTAAITGFVPLAGFWSKDAILGGALFSANPATDPGHAVSAGTIAYVVGSIAALCTAFYMTRLVVLTFWGEPRTPAAQHAHESSPVMTWPLVVLAAGAVLGVLVAWPFEVPHPRLADLLAQLTEPVFRLANRQVAANAHAVLGAAHGEHPAWPYFAAWALAAVGTAAAWSFYAGAWRGVPDWFARTFPRTYRFTVDKFRVDELYGFGVAGFGLLADLLWKGVDKGVIDKTVDNVGSAARGLGKLGRTFQNGDVQRYGALMAVAAAVMLAVVLGLGLGGR